MKHVLLIHGGAVGDFVMTLRIVAGLRAHGVQTVTILGRPAIARLGLLGGGVDRVLDLEAGRYHALFAHDVGIPEQVRQAVSGVDAVIDMLSGRDTPLSSRMQEMGIKRVVQIDPRPRDDWHEHITDQWLSDLRRAGIELEAEMPRLAIDVPASRQALRQLARESPPTNVQAHGLRIILHPGSGGTRKCWPADSFIALNERLRHAGCETRFLLGPVEAECMRREDLDRFRAGAPLLTDLPLENVAACLACADVFVGNDSGISHLAAALGTRTMAVFGPTDPRLWRPLGSHVTVLQGKPPTPWPEADAVLRLLVP